LLIVDDDRGFKKANSVHQNVANINVAQDRSVWDAIMRTSPSSNRRGSSRGPIAVARTCAVSTTTPKSHTFGVNDL